VQAFLNQHWPALSGLEPRPETGGLINRTFLLGEPPLYVLQQVNRIFGEAVHEDIQAVTNHLRSKGLAAPELLSTQTGALYARDNQGEIWRVFHFLPGVCHHRVQNPALAHAAGALVARFHQAMQDFSYSYQHIPLEHMIQWGICSGWNRSWLPERPLLVQKGS